MLYVKAIQGKPAARALATDRTLVNLLVRSMDEGWTSGTEQAAINWLKSI